MQSEVKRKRRRSAKKTTCMQQLSAQVCVLTNAVVTLVDRGAASSSPTSPTDPVPHRLQLLTMRAFALVLGMMTDEWIRWLEILRTKGLEGLDYQKHPCAPGTTPKKALQRQAGFFCEHGLPVGVCLRLKLPILKKKKVMVSVMYLCTLE